MEAPTPTPEQLAAIRSARRASLLRKWTSGRHLSIEEMAEIADLLPAELLAHPPAVPARYARLQADYAATYNVAVREIKRWVAKGRAAKPIDPPPLDDPVAMLDWWPKHNKRRVPQRLLDAADRHRDPSPPAPPASLREPSPDGPDAVQPDPPATPEPRELQPEELTFGANIDRMRRAVAEAHREYEGALAANDEGRAQNAMRRWADLSENLRKLEKDRADVEQAMGDTIPRAAVARVLGEVHGTIASGLRAMVRRIRPELEAAPPDAWDPIWQRELDRLFGLWSDIRFTGGRADAP